MFTLFDSADYLCVDTERTTDFDYPWGDFGADIYFHSMAHVEHLIHFAPVGPATFFDGFEQGWQWEKIVFNYMTIVTDKM